MEEQNHNGLIWPDSHSGAINGKFELAGHNTHDIVQKWGTPLYIFDEMTIKNHCQRYKAALKTHYPGASAVHYASKAYLNTAIATLLKDEGLEFDVVSIGEFALALRAGVKASSINFHGNAKPEAELKKAIMLGVGSIVIDNLDEINILKKLCPELNKIQDVLIRITPNIDTKTHPHIQTGQRTSKFGLPIEQLDAAVEDILSCSFLKLKGLHFHLGSQIEETDSFVASIEVVLNLYARLKEKFGIVFSEISPGGGLGVVYNESDNPVSIDEYIKEISQAIITGCKLRGLQLPKLTLEPGRSIIARAAVAFYSVIAKKYIPGNDQDKPIQYIHIDGGMGDNIRPSLYSAKYTACLANRMDDKLEQRVNVAGRYCESGDVLLTDYMMPKDINIGDVIAVAGVGAYTLSMSSTYNMVPRPAVLMLGKNGYTLIQRRETEDDMFSRDL